LQIVDVTFHLLGARRVLDEALKDPTQHIPHLLGQFEIRFVCSFGSFIGLAGIRQRFHNGITMLKCSRRALCVLLSVVLRCPGCFLAAVGL
jgi:hypothetical protein